MEETVMEMKNKIKEEESVISELQLLPREMQDQFIQKYYVKVKNRASFAHHTMFREDVEPPAKKEGKIPILITHKKNAKSGALVVLKLNDFLELIKK